MELHKARGIQEIEQDMSVGFRRRRKKKMPFQNILLNFMDSVRLPSNGAV